MIERLRKICLALPDAVETTNFGHPFFRIGKKPFCVFHGRENEPAIAFKVLKNEAGIFLKIPDFSRLRICTITDGFPFTRKANSTGRKSPNS